MRKADCIFCKIINGEISSFKIWEDSDLLAFLDMNPINPGHVLVVTKEHFDDLISTPDDLISKTMIQAKIIGKAIIKSGLGDGINFQINNGQAAGQAVGHFHLHLLPRKPNDGRELWKGKPYEAGEAEQAVNILKNHSFK